MRIPLYLKRLSPLGAAVLILIMTVMLYPVLPPEPKEAHAVTRLGLHVTQEELNIWRQRRTDNVNTINGYTFQQVYQNRTLAQANSFKSQVAANPSNPSTWDGYWAGYTGSGCAMTRTANPPTRAWGRLVMQSAFNFLLTGDTSYADPVKTLLLKQITVPGTDFNNTSKWCRSGNGVEYMRAIDASEIWVWQARLLFAYDYLLAGGYTGFTAQDKANIVNWFNGGALLWDSVLTFTITWSTQSGFFSTPQDETCNTGRACPGSPFAGVAYFGGPQEYSFHNTWNSNLTYASQADILIGILTNNATLKDHGIRHVKGWIRVNVHGVI
jgi:hypothetical protein